ncbi:hypothetical protein ACFQGT_20115 [Natrialbaceae archaeon GCM10025810]|uniref:hypothetical protein n=1 Tax=Halovalidus salilacus TaxID=3075124 RepID=UPI00360E467E
MITTRSLVLFLGVLVVGLTIGPIAGSALDGPAGSDSANGADVAADSNTDLESVADDGSSENESESASGTETTENESESAPSTETNVSTFMQSSTAAADDEVESGLFRARYENADNGSRADVVTDRTERLEAELASLEEQYEAVQERRNTSNASPVASEAQLTRLSVRIASLESSIDETESRAERAGVDTERLDELRRNASELNRPEVARTVSSIPGVGPRTDVGVPGGPNGNDTAAEAPGRASKDRGQTGAGNASSGDSDDRGGENDSRASVQSASDSNPDGDSNSDADSGEKSADDDSESAS